MITGFLAGVTSCSKDLGNYKYKAINDITFTNLDTVNGYQVNLGDTLHIIPVVTASLDGSLSGNYSYSWNLLPNSYNSFTNQQLSAEKNLNFPINFPPGTYSISYSVKDEKTGIEWLQKIPLTVITPYYEGWLVLNKVSDSSRLDFLSYQNNGFALHTDILSRLNTGIPHQGLPSQVFFANGYLSQLSGVFLFTASGANNLNPENFSYSPAGNLSGYFLGNPPPDFMPGQMIFVKSPVYYTDNLFAYAKNNLYFNNSGAFFYGTPLNTSSTTGQSFPVSPFIASSGGYRPCIVMYDMLNRKFVYVMKQNGLQFSKVLDVTPEFNFPNGEDLLYMTDNGAASWAGTNTGYAVLKDHGADNFYMLTFSFSSNQLQASSYYKPINATDFNLAEHYAISPDLGYLFYSVGGKLYEYDLFLQTSKLMLDKGNQKISLLVFDTNDKPAAWQNWLTVGYYDPAGVPGQNGTLAEYSVPPVNGTLIQQYQWTGFGEIRSVSYRYRARTH